MRRTHPILIIHPSFNIGGVIEWRIATRSEKDQAHKEKGTPIFIVAFSSIVSILFPLAEPRYNAIHCAVIIRFGLYFRDTS